MVIGIEGTAAVSGPSQTLRRRWQPGDFFDEFLQAAYEEADVEEEQPAHLGQVGHLRHYLDDHRRRHLPSIDLWLL